MPEETDQQTPVTTPGASPKKGYKFIQWDDSGTVAHLTMNRPKQNVMNIEMLHEMTVAIESLNHREEVRLILLDAAPDC